MHGLGHRCARASRGRSIKKSGIKAQIRAQKARRDAALAAHDAAELRAIRKKINALKRKIRRATV